MATLTTATYLDDLTRVAGESMTLNGGILTVRTDTRFSAGSPASMTGSLGAVTISSTLGGGYILDGSAVRWLPYNTGSGNAPAIGTSITQGDVSGYLLGVWTNLTSAPIAVGAAINATGFIKLRSVVGGAFTAGALGGITATSTGADVAGWIEVVHDAASDLTIPRLGYFRTRSQKFFLDNTTGSSGQVLQTPTNGGGALTIAPGVWIEDAPSTDNYTFFPALSGIANGWQVAHIGSPNIGGVGADKRQRFVKDIGNGQMQIGEDVTRASSYIAGVLFSTYAFAWTITSTYTWVANVVTVTTGTTVHGFGIGDTVTLTFTSGGAFTPVNKSGTFTVASTPLTTTFTVALTGSGTAGNCTSYKPADILITTGTTPHGILKGDSVYHNFTTGTATPSGNYTVTSIHSTTTYRITASGGSTVGNVTVCAKPIGTYTWVANTQTVTCAAHGFRIGENVRLTGHTGTITSTYTWIANVVTVTTGITEHGYVAGNTLTVTFTSGGAFTPVNKSGSYTIVSTPTTSSFTIAVTGSGTAGNCTIVPADITCTILNVAATTVTVYRPGAGNAGSVNMITRTQVSHIGWASTYTWVGAVVTVDTGATVHGLLVNDIVYIDFLTGGATADASYTVVSTPTTTSFTFALTGSGASGNCTTFFTHGLNIGQKVYLDTFSGVGTAGVYMVESIPTAFIYTINMTPATIGVGTVTGKFTCGYVPVANCKTWIPNVIGRQCATGARATNSAPNATIGSRPEFVTTSAGAIDIDGLYSDWYLNFSQAYSVKLHDVAYFDSLVISECATTIDIDGLGSGMYGALAALALSLISNFTGGTISNAVIGRGNVPVASGYSLSVTYSRNIIFTNVIVNQIQYVRLAVPWYIGTCANLTLTNCKITNSSLSIATSTFITINNFDMSDRLSGLTNAGGGYAIAVGAGCTDITIDGYTNGFANTIADVHPYGGILNITADTRVKLRNIGTSASPLSLGSIPLYQGGSVVVSGGNNDTVAIQRCYCVNTRTGVITYTNTDKNVLIESTWGDFADAQLISVLASKTKGLGAAIGTTAQSANYDCHWVDGYIAGVPTSTSSQAWARTTTTARISSVGHHLAELTGTAKRIIVTVSSDTAAIPLGLYSATMLGNDTFNMTCLNAGATTGTISYIAENGLLQILGNESTVAASKVYTIVTMASGLNPFTSAGTVYMPAVNDEIEWFNPDYVLGHSSFPIDEAVMTGGTITNHWITYKIDKNDGNGYNASYRNLSLPTLTTFSGTSGNRVVTVNATTFPLIAVGDYCFGTGIAPLAYVTAKYPDASLGANQIQVSANNTATLSGIGRFNYLPNEGSISSSLGFKLKVDIKTVVVNVAAITCLTIYTNSNVTDRTYQYPLNTALATLKLTGLKTGTEIRVYKTSDMSYIAGVESSTDEFSYEYLWEGTDINCYIMIHALNYVSVRYEGQLLGQYGLTLPIQQQRDRVFNDPT